MLWGIDLGGTKIEGVVIRTLEPLETACRIRIPTEANRGYAHIVDQIAKLISQMEEESGLKLPAHIGLGTPGTVDPPTGLMKNCNTTCLNGKPLPADAQAALHTEVTVANDANCFALAETLLGAGRGFPSVFGVILGTGVGGGIVIDGRVVVGCHGIAGEWGHMTLEPNGAACYCGRIGCVETVLCGPALERFYAHRAGATKRLDEIVEASRAGTDGAASATVERLCVKFGEAISQVVNVLDPHAIVLGGGVGKVDELYTRGVAELAKNVFNDKLITKVLRPELGDSAGVFGAALLTAT